MNSYTADNLDWKQNSSVDASPELSVWNQWQRKKSAKGMLFIHLKKAFDTIDKKILINNLNSSYKIANSE